MLSLVDLFTRGVIADGGPSKFLTAADEVTTELFEPVAKPECRNTVVAVVCLHGDHHVIWRA